MLYRITANNPLILLLRNDDFEITDYYHIGELESSCPVDIKFPEGTSFESLVKVNEDLSHDQFEIGFDKVSEFLWHNNDHNINAGFSFVWGYSY